MYLKNFKTKSYSMNTSITYKSTISIKVSVTVCVRTFVGDIDTFAWSVRLPIFPEYPIIVLSHYYLVNNILGDILTTIDIFTLGGFVIPILSLFFSKMLIQQFGHNFCKL